MIETNSNWILAPAYDLLNVAIVNPEDKEELALTLEGKKKKLAKGDFIKLGHNLDLNDKQINGVFKRLKSKQHEIVKIVNTSFLSEKMKENYIEIVLKRADILFN